MHLQYSVYMKSIEDTAFKFIYANHAASSTADIVECTYYQITFVVSQNSKNNVTALIELSILLHFVY